MPELFASVEARHAIPSLAEIYRRPLGYREVPDLLCLDLYRDFDFNTLTVIAAPVKIDLLAKEPESIFWR
jgi:hypothetical protein